MAPRNPLMYRMYECLERQEPEKGHPEHKKTLKFEGLLQHYTIRMLFK